VAIISRSADSEVSHGGPQHLSEERGWVPGEG
jgi:hypothetical protein